MSVTYEFRKRNILVTGGAKGVGRATVEKFLQAGARVFVVDKDEKSIAKLLNEHPEVTAAVVDLQDWEATARAVQQFGPIHHLVNNAGIGHQPTSFLDLRPQQVDVIFDVNLKAIINVSQVMAKSVATNKIEGATIVNIASVMSKLPYKGVALYSASKAAVSMLSRSMAVELEPLGIRVNTVSPTIMRTDLTQDSASFDVNNEAASNAEGDASVATAQDEKTLTPFMQYLVGRQIIKRLLTVDETADLILYLSTANSSFLDGQEIFIDGGLMEN